ncbi:MAG TPA: nucleoside-diphosphate kinase [Halobacteriales archaeon]|jgi:nucleoside-diphosphate kinase|nr:nucleoside-diphosphate kinase [Halobacteriales archaeon]|tara:strand:- start:12200 stop:12658 length:459 start_codon:yes stop_codon:yes gene_type:complete
MTRERTFVLIKPDGVQRGLIGTIISRFEKRGLKLVGSKLLTIDLELAQKHYSEHVGKPFFDGLVEFICSGPSFAMVLEGKNAVSIVRQMMGSTDPSESPPGTIRGDFGIDLGRNVIHGSDTNPGSNEREINLFFDELEFSSYERIDETWLYE